MYEIVNKDTIYGAGVIGHGLWSKYEIFRIGNEKDFIRYLASQYQDLFYLVDKGEVYYKNCAYDPDLFEFFDGYGRPYNPRAYEQDAWEFYLENFKGHEDKLVKKHSYKSNIQYIFRKGAVPYTAKTRGGPDIRPRRIKQLVAMYDNPEYKEFNRGSKKELPDGWWDDWSRSVEKNWKSQRKVRHQWQR